MLRTKVLRIIGIIVFLIVLLLGVEFSTVNSDPVTVNYLLGTASWPLALVVVCAFAVGVLVTFLVSLSVVLPLRWRVMRLQRAVSNKEDELGTLRKRSDRGIPHV